MYAAIHVPAGIYATSQMCIRNRKNPLRRTTSKHIVQSQSQYLVDPLQHTRGSVFIRYTVCDRDQVRIVVDKVTCGVVWITLSDVVVICAKANTRACPQQLIDCCLDLPVSVSVLTAKNKIEMLLSLH